MSGQAAVAFDGMDERQVCSLVYGWYTRARREDDHVTSFVFLWFCFNAWLACESGEDTDWAMINWLTGRRAQTSQLRAAYDSAMQSEVFVDSVRALADQSPIVSNGRRPREVRIHSLEDFADIVNGVYLVRCNLFHGSKRAGDSRDETLIGACARILEQWVGYLVAGWQ
jgi:hypothetical protein